MLTGYEQRRLVRPSMLSVRPYVFVRNAWVHVVDSVGQEFNSPELPIQVSDPIVPPTPITGILSAHPVQAVTGEVVTFSIQITGGVGPFTYHWEFGDGTSADTTEPIGYHIYSPQ